MNPTTIMLVAAGLAGIFGWPMMQLFINAVLWTCDYLDGAQTNWGMTVVYTIAVPFAWLFAVYEIMILYF